ncbi:MAG: PQQ-dependent sugar dehydrogenase [Bacteroidota bacterium]|nr:PQQ-dependent sugar dehydrogenase [Bacteroidota bacterium]
MFKIVVISFSLFVFNLCAQSLPQGFKLEQVATLQNPVSMAFTPDGRILLARQDGYMYVVQNGTLITTPALTLTDSIFWGNEKGFLGIAVDPDFNTNGYIYCYYTINVRYNFYNGVQLTLNNTIRHKIARYTMNGNLVLPGSKKTILDMDITPGSVINVNHDGGQMQFGPDGKLYLVTGEGDLWCPCFTPTSTSCDWSCNSCQGVSSGCISYQWADNWNSYFGKILRINKDGSAPSDNPFYSSPSPTFGPQKYFYARGFRNPFTMHFRPGTSDIYVNDVGSSNASAREEISKVTPSGGKHFGWPSVEGTTSSSNFVNPIYMYQHCTNPTSGCNIKTGTTVGCAITGGIFYSSVSGSNWPSMYNNKYFYMDFCNGYINTIDVDNGNTVQNFATGLANNIGNANSGIGALFLEVGPDGQMYYITRSLNAGSTGLYRISYQPNSVTSINITTSSLNISSCGGTLLMGGAVSPSNASIPSILWSTSPSNIATINNNGLLTAIDNGVVTVTAIASSDFSIKSFALVTISGQTPTTSISITGPGGTLTPSINTYGGSVQLSPSTNGCTGFNQGFGWEIIKQSNGVVVTVSSNGLVSSLGSDGTVTISGFVIGNLLLQKNIQINISGQTIAPQTISLSANTTTFSPNINVITVNGNVLPTNTTNKNLSWMISSTGVTFLYNTFPGNNLIITCIGIANNQNIIVTATSLSVNSVVSTINLKVSNKIDVQSIGLSASSASFNTDLKIITVTGTILPGNASNKNFTWQISTTGVNVSQQVGANNILIITFDGIANNQTVQVKAISSDINTIIGIINIPIYNNITIQNIQISSTATVFNLTTNVITFIGIPTPSNAVDLNFIWQVSTTGINVTSQTTIGNNLIVTCSNIESNQIVQVKAISTYLPSVYTTLNVNVESKIPSQGLNIQVANSTEINDNNKTITLTGIITPSNATNKDIVWEIIQGASSIKTTTLSGNQLEIIAVNNSIDIIKIKAISSDNNLVSTTINIPINISTLNINSNSNQILPFVVIFPNPTSGKFFLLSDLIRGDIELSIMNQKGDIPYYSSIKNYNGKKEIDLSNVAKGYYILTIGTPGAAFHQRLILE